MFRAKRAESSFNPVRAMKPMGALCAEHSKRVCQSGTSTVVAAANASYACFSSNFERFALLLIVPSNPFLHTEAKYPTGVLPAERLLRLRPEELPLEELPANAADVFIGVIAGVSASSVGTAAITAGEPYPPAPPEFVSS